MSHGNIFENILLREFLNMWTLFIKVFLKMQSLENNKCLNFSHENTKRLIFKDVNNGLDQKMSKK